MQTKDNKINELLKRAKEYRKDLSKSAEELGNYGELMETAIEEVLQEKEKENIK